MSVRNVGDSDHLVGESLLLVLVVGLLDGVVRFRFGDLGLLDGDNLVSFNFGDSLLILNLLNVHVDLINSLLDLQVVVLNDLESLLFHLLVVLLLKFVHSFGLELSLFLVFNDLAVDELVLLLDLRLKSFDLGLSLFKIFLVGLVHGGHSADGGLHLGVGGSELLNFLGEFFLSHLVVLIVGSEGSDFLFLVGDGGLEGAHLGGKSVLLVDEFLLSVLGSLDLGVQVIDHLLHLDNGGLVLLLLFLLFLLESGDNLFLDEDFLLDGGDSFDGGVVGRFLLGLDQLSLESLESLFVLLDSLGGLLSLFLDLLLKSENGGSGGGDLLFELSLLGFLGLGLLFDGEEEVFGLLDSDLELSILGFELAHLSLEFVLGLLEVGDHALLILEHLFGFVDLFLKIFELLVFFLLLDFHDLDDDVLFSNGLLGLFGFLLLLLVLFDNLDGFDVLVNLDFGLELGVLSAGILESSHELFELRESTASTFLGHLLGLFTTTLDQRNNVVDLFLGTSEGD